MWADLYCGRDDRQGDLVTSGAGRIGSDLVVVLLGAGREFRLLDDCSTGLRSNLAVAAADLYARARRSPAHP